MIHPASKASFLPARFWHRQERLCIYSRRRVGALRDDTKIVGCVADYRPKEMAISS